MTERVYGNLRSHGIEVVRRAERYFVRYDAGSHQIAWREDEITPEEFELLRRSKAEEYEVIIGLQRRLRQTGEDPNTQNWSPPIV